MVVPKKMDPSMYKVSYRMVIDHRKINGHLEYWSYTLKRIVGLFSKLHGAKLLSTLNVRSGSDNIIMDENSRKYPAFTKEHGKYEILCVAFGRHIAPNYFTMVINKTLKGLDFCFILRGHYNIIQDWKRTPKQH